MQLMNFDGTSKTKFSFGHKSKDIFSTMDFTENSFRVVNKDGTIASLHISLSSDEDSAVPRRYVDTVIQSMPKGLVSNEEENGVVYDVETGTLSISSVGADRIVGLAANSIVVTDENGHLTTSSVSKSALENIGSLTEDIQKQLDEKANVSHTHKAEDIEGISDLSVKYATEAGAASNDANGSPILSYVQSLKFEDLTLTATHGDGTSEKIMTLDSDAITNIFEDIGVTKENLTAISGVTSNIQVQLDSKAELSHTHKISDIEGLQEALDGKADATHRHGLEDLDIPEATYSSAGLMSAQDKFKLDNKFIGGTITTTETVTDEDGNEDVVEATVATIVTYSTVDPDTGLFIEGGYEVDAIPALT